MPILVITGTGTEVGKTVTTAAVAAAALAAGRSVAVLKAAQTGVRPDERGDAEEVARLAGDVRAAELARYPEPLAPATAALRAGMVPVRPREVADAAAKLATEHDLVLVEGAGGLLVRFDEAGGTLADAAELLRAPVLVVASAGLGTLNTTDLTARELRSRGVELLGVVIGSWPDSPDLAMRCNVTDLPDVAGAPLLGALPAGSGALPPAEFRRAAPGWLASRLDGTWEAETFRRRTEPPDWSWPAESRRG
ncbi:dethiobiotin synthase [Streptomyces sp. NPDC006259]|uniref:dethiobiotin synthase n=1 Tax=unclassified Streptomyces TaxID=2593676 RepID=UPI00339EC114